MQDPTDYYLGVGISVVILSFCLINIYWNMFCHNSHDFDESYTEARNDPV